MCPVVVKFSAFLGVVGPGAARARRRPRAARRCSGQATPRRCSPASRAPATARRRGPTFRPGRAGFALALVLAPVPSAHLPRGFRTPSAGKPSGGPLASETQCTHSTLSAQDRQDASLVGALHNVIFDSFLRARQLLTSNYLKACTRCICNSMCGRTMFLHSNC